MVHKKVLLITSTNLACNPRCLKEVKLLCEKQAEVTVVAFNLRNWSAAKEKELNQQLPDVRFHYLENSRNNFIAWLMASVIEKAGRFFSPIFSGSLFWASMAIGKSSWMLLRWIKNASEKHDLIIAHNPAAFYPACRYAQKYKVPFALDIEDYHPGETLQEVVKNGIGLLMSKLIPKAVYTSFASAPIMAMSKKIISDAPGPLLVINNFFPSENFENIPAATNEKLQLVWFSQNIDCGRGLEELLAVFDSIADDFELTLIGNKKEPFYTDFIRKRIGIRTVDAMHPDLLTKMIGQFDIGLAIEPGKDLNNTLALSNKILSYFQAGLYILASETEGQAMFMAQHPNHGVCTSLDADVLPGIFDQLKKNKEQIRLQKSARFSSAANFNWEHESVLLTKQWEAVLQ